eukprot:9405235-Alexandrium_andersonii.AAC.1
MLREDAPEFASAGPPAGEMHKEALGRAEPGPGPACDLKMPRTSSTPDRNQRTAQTSPCAHRSWARNRSTARRCPGTH